ncbi:hypothetical protein DXC62_06330 [Ruminococcaceae bacterium TF06-43]|nr:hypothetical protein DXC62_06330 [Ruminococcaceae bacterium TF06-43]
MLLLSPQKPLRWVSVGPHIRALRTSSAMGRYTPQTPCALCAAKHPLCVCSDPQSLLSPH